MNEAQRSKSSSPPKRVCYLCVKGLTCFWIISENILPFFSAKAMASSFEENDSTMLERGSALKRTIFTSHKNGGKHENNAGVTGNNPTNVKKEVLTWRPSPSAGSPSAPGYRSPSSTSWGCCFRTAWPFWWAQKCELYGFWCAPLGLLSRWWCPEGKAEETTVSSRSTAAFRTINKMLTRFLYKCTFRVLQFCLKLNFCRFCW